MASSSSVPKNNIKINKDTIPAATQLFTPEWIVKYMVENSLGRLWLDAHPNADLRSKWKYYVDEAEQEPEVAEQLRVLRSQSPVKRPEGIKLIDPCMGSGHILVYAFDVLFQIYQSEGYSEREIPNLILQNNIFGLDIDDRAGQLAYFALIIKARSYSRRFLRQDNIPQPMVYAIPETHSVLMGASHFYGVGMNEDERNKCKNDLFYIFELFQNGKEYGSAMKIEREIDYERLKEYIHDNPHGQITFEESRIPEQNELLDRMIDVAVVLSQKYDVVVTNPPYMGNSGMGAKLTEYVKKNYPASKSDMSTVFMEKTLELCKPHGYMSMINIPVWMFLSSYEKLRGKLLSSNTFINMLHFGRGVFGADFGTTSFIIAKESMQTYLGTYKRLFEKPSSVDTLTQKEKWFYSDFGTHYSTLDRFNNIPGNPIAYWITNQEFNNFINGQPLKEIASPKQGLATGNNDLFLKYWFEVSLQNIGFGYETRETAEASKNKWFPCNKGGNFRKWYGNNEYIVNWEFDGLEIRNYKDPNGKLNSRPQNMDNYFQEGITWSTLSISSLSMRYSPKGHMFETKGSVCFFKCTDNLKYTLGAMNTVIVNRLLLVLCPTVDFHEGPIGRVPIIIDERKKANVDAIVQNCITISQNDWDSFEVSWDFQTHPLVKYKIMGALENTNYSGTLDEAFKWWAQNAERQFNKLKSNEEELNRIFIEIYGLQDELTPEVEEKDVTVRKADLGRDIRSFLSYAVGCMFGRYSLDEPGLAFAGGTFDIAKYKTFMPEDDNIIPIGSADYFDDDIVVRFVEFVRVVYGDNTLGENLSFIADALYPNGSGTAQERIRRYFLNDFYKDHVKIYQKRPIYWLLDSGKKDGFKALFYLHRYDKYTIARTRTDYLHPLQRKYEAEIKRLEMLSDSTDNAREKAACRKEIDVLLNKIDECRVYDQVVSHIAHQQIELDLDDGVKVNYEKFQGVAVPKDNGKTEMMDLLAKI